MRPTISQFTAFLYATLAAGASTTTRVDVGLNGALAFSPDTIKASVGDVLEFHFHPINHSVVMSDFNNPCAPATTGGFFSGFMPVSSGEAADVFRVTVNATDPIFFYCAQNILSHCKSGMPGVVNPSTDQTLAKYQAAAKSVSSATNPPAQFGGILAANSAPSASPSTSAKPTSNGGGLYGTGNAGTTLSISPLIWLSLASAAVASFLL